MCVCMFDLCGLETLEFWRPKPNVDCYAAEKEKHSLRNFQKAELFGRTWQCVYFFLNHLTRSGSPLAVPRRLPLVSDACFSTGHLADQYPLIHSFPIVSRLQK